MVKISLSQYNGVGIMSNVKLDGCLPVVCVLCYNRNAIKCKWVLLTPERKDTNRKANKVLTKERNMENILNVRLPKIIQRETIIL